MGVTALATQQHRFLASATSFMVGGIPGQYANTLIEYGKRELEDLYSPNAGTLVGLNLRLANENSSMAENKSPSHISGITSVSDGTVRTV